MPLLGEFCRTSRDFFELELDSHKSWDVRRKSPKSGKTICCHFWANFAECPGICANLVPIRTNPGTFGKIRPVACDFSPFFATFFFRIDFFVSGFFCSSVRPSVSPSVRHRSVRTEISAKTDPRPETGPDRTGFDPRSDGPDECRKFLFR